MLKFCLRIVVGFVTFVLGTSVAYLMAKSWTAPYASAIIVVPMQRPEVPRFSAVARGCGAGYSQLYVTDDDQHAAEGVAWNPSRKVTKRNFRKAVKDAKRVIERAPNFRGYPGKVGERIIVLNHPNARGAEWVSILFYDGGDAYRFIDAPTLDLALEFEQYVISINFKSPM